MLRLAEHAQTGRQVERSDHDPIDAFHGCDLPSGGGAGCVLDHHEDGRSRIALLE